MPNTQTLSLVPTHTDLPETATIAPSTNTPTHTQTLSHTMMPTLSPEDAHKTILNLMQSNGDCPEPCFWGIYPGITEPLDAYDFLSDLSIFLNRSMLEYREDEKINYVVNFKIRDLTETKNVAIMVEIFLTQSTVLTVHARIVDLDDPEITKGDWTAYRPDAVLGNYGNPSKIKLSVVEGPNGQISYVMRFIYNNEQLIADYWLGDWSGHTETRLVCPLKNSEIRAFDYWLGEIQENSPDVNQGFDLSEISSLSITDFAQLLINEPSSVCFEVNEAILFGE